MDEKTSKFFLTYPKLPPRKDILEVALSHYKKVFCTHRDAFLYAAAIKLHKDGELIHPYDTYNESQIRIFYDYIIIPANLLKIFTTNKPDKFLSGDRALKRRFIISNYLS